MAAYNQLFVPTVLNSRLQTFNLLKLEVFCRDDSRHSLNLIAPQNPVSQPKLPFSIAHPIALLELAHLCLPLLCSVGRSDHLALLPEILVGIDSHETG